MVPEGTKGLERANLGTLAGIAKGHVSNAQTLLYDRFSSGREHLHLLTPRNRELQLEWIWAAPGAPVNS